MASSTTQTTTTSGATTTFYGPPYRDNYAYHNDGYSSSVSAALSTWWAQYQLDWPGAFPGCSYTPGFPANGAQTGLFATISLQGRCGGGGGIYGTAYTYKPGKANGKPCNCVGDPINFGTGNEFRDDLDIVLGALSFHRFYNSTNAVASAHVGSHWRHSFDRSIEYLHDSANATVTVYRPDGLQVVFTLQSGAWVADPDVADTLSPVYDASSNLIGWFYTNAATRELEDYDAQGHLLSITDVNKHLTVFTYSNASTPSSIAPTAGLLLTATDPLGRQLSFTYNSLGNIATVTQPNGGATSYNYDTNNNLVQVTYPDAQTRKYVYNESTLTSNTSLPNALTGEIDETNTRLTDIGYDNQGRAILSRMAGNVDVTQVSYGTTGTNVVTYPTGVQVTYGFSTPNGSMHASSASGPCGPNCGQGFASLTFDTNGYPSTGTDFNGHITQSTYNTQGLITTQIEASSENTQRTTATTWDVNNRVPLTRSIADAGNAVKAITAWVYNSRAQVIARCEIDPSLASGYTCSSTGTTPAGVRRWTYTYCETVNSTQCPLIGLLLGVTGPRTDLAQTASYGYYLSSSATSCGTPGAACYQAGDIYQVTDAMGHVTTIASYDANGRVTRTTDANGINTDLTYTPRGWLATSTVGGATTTINYTLYGAVASITDADSVTVNYSYDTAHRLTKITDALGNYVQYTLDAAGNKTAEQTYDSSNTLRRSLSRTYNTLGQLTQITDGLSHAIFNAAYTDSYDANGNLVHTADALGVQRKQGYDGLNRLITTIDNYNGTDTATQNTQSAFAYDANDRLEGVSDPDGLNTTYSYDGLGNATGVQSPDTGSTAYVYDAAGNVTQRTDAKGVVSNSTYDALNRRTATTYADGTLNVAYAYDEANSVTGCPASYPVGRLTRIIETAVTTVYCYDAHGNVIRKSQTQGTVTDVTAYGYTLADRLASTLTPAGTSIQYSRDAAGRITGVTALPPGTSGAGAGNVVTAISYLPFGPIASYTLGNGQTITRTYDANYAVTDVVSPALNLHFARDAMGNITALGNASGASPATETYTYDPLYRLTGLYDTSNNPEETYTYSKTGDRLSKTGNGLATGAYTYQSGTHHLTAIGNAARTYDANGNTTGSVIGGDTLGYGYNGRNRMTVLQRDGSTVGSYTYNALGQRTAKVVTFPAASSQRFAYDEASQLIGEYGSSSRDYVWLDDLPVATVDTTSGVSTVSYVHADGLNTPRAVANTAGNTVWQLAYQANAFGEQQPTSTNGFVYGPRFSGQYYDAESGIVHNGFRDYESATGRYIHSDPIGLNGGPSTYPYVGSNPLSFVDALGLQAENERDLLEPIDVAAPINAATYRDLFARIRQYDKDFEDPIMSRGDPVYTRPDVERLEEVLRGKVVEGCRAPAPRQSPAINPADVAGLKPHEIDAFARQNGLDPAGPDPMNGRGAYIDPITGNQRILSHPDAEPPHAHVNDPSGQRLDINGNNVPPESPGAHLPIGK